MRLVTKIDTCMAQDWQNRACPPRHGTAPVWRQHVAPWGTFGSSRQRMTLLSPLLILTPMTSSLLSRAPDWLRPRPRCRHAAVGTRMSAMWLCGRLATLHWSDWQYCLCSLLKGPFLLNFWSGTAMSGLAISAPPLRRSIQRQWL